MFSRFRRTRIDPAIPSALYGAIVAQARNPALYAGIGVPDTVEGRFEAVVIHTVLVIRRLVRGDEAARAVAQEVFDIFCVEMDDALRGLGVADTRVPKRMRKLGEAYFGRRAAYEAALDADDPAGLAAALGRTVFGGAGDGMAAAALAAYMSAAERALAGTPAARVAAGTLSWPEIDRFVRAEKLP